MVDYGSDFKGTEDLDPFLSCWDESEEESALAMTEAMIVRFDTTRKALFYDESYGLNLAQFVLDNLDPQVAEQLVVTEALKDERAARCLCKITVQVDGSWKIQINPKTESGAEYRLVFLADASKVSLLTNEQV
jgi:hypothetical protein